MEKELTKQTSYPVFNGLGRKPTFMGIPTTYGLGAFALIAILAMTFSLKLWGLLFVVMPAMAIITKSDDKAFDILALEIKTRLTNKNKKFWGGSSYAPTEYSNSRPWIALLKEETNG